MPNRFVGEWGSHVRPDGSVSSQEGTFEMSDIDATHVNVRFKPLGGSYGSPMMVQTSNTVPPSIAFVRTDRTGTTMYTGFMVREVATGSDPIGRIAGAFKFTPAVATTFADVEGDWTANRPPPRPGKRTKADRKNGKGAAKQAKAGKKPVSRKAVKSQKSASKSKGTPAAKSARSSKTGKKAR